MSNRGLSALYESVCQLDEHTEPSIPCFFVLPYSSFLPNLKSLKRSPVRPENNLVDITQTSDYSLVY